MTHEQQQAFISALEEYSIPEVPYDFWFGFGCACGMISRIGFIPTSDDIDFMAPLIVECIKKSK